MKTTTNVYLTEPDERRTMEMALRWHPPMEMVPDPKTGVPVRHPGVRCLTVLHDRGDVNERQLSEAADYLREAIDYYGSGASHMGMEGIPGQLHAVLDQAAAEALVDLTEAANLIGEMSAHAVGRANWRQEEAL